MAKTKLTLVSMYCQGKKLAVFMNLPINSYGRPVLPDPEQLMNSFGWFPSRGVTFSTG